MTLKLTTIFKVALLGMLTMLLACDANGPDSKATSEAASAQSSDYVAHVAFAGGGWRAHSGHSGWIIALLDSNRRSLSSAFQNVKTLSSNSGGSWFNAMLTYSEKFASQIQHPHAVRNWINDGWLGHQKAMFAAAPCHIHSGETFSACVADHYAGTDLHPLGALYWRKIVDAIAFNKYPVEGTLNGGHLAWASDKSLLFASSLLTNQVMMNREGVEHEYYTTYYQACLAPGTVKLNGKKGGSCNPAATADLIPVIFSSLPKNSGLTPPPLLPALNTQSGHDSLAIGYSQLANDDPNTQTIYLKNPISDTTLEIKNAAAASSAALGGGASKGVSDSWDISWTLVDEALSFQLADGKVNYKDPGDMSVADLANNAMVRVADGGMCDNSAVSQIVTFLQQNGQEEGFNIIAFDNVQEVYPLDCSYPQVGIDIANLFGQGICNGNQFCLEDDCGAPCMDVPQLQIFDEAAIQAPVTKWEAVKKPAYPTQMLMYRKYAVTTVDNPNFGIKGGKSGTLHTFTCHWENANIAPENGGKWFYQDTVTNADFNAYNDMIQFIYSSMQNGGLKPHLDDAFGLKDN